MCYEYIYIYRYEYMRIDRRKRLQVLSENRQEKEATSAKCK